MMSANVPALRHNRDYGWLWLGQAVSLLGDEVFVITIMLWVGTVVVGDLPWAPLAVAVVMVAEALPVMLFSLIAGVYSDRWNRRRIMLVTDAARCILIGGLAGVAIAGPAVPQGVLFAATAAVGMLVSTATVFFNPARFGLLGAVVADADRERMASVATGTAALTGIIGPSLGAVLFVMAGVQWAMLLNAASFAVSFVAVARVRTGRNAVAADATAARPSMRRELMTGFRFLAGNRSLKILLFTSIAITAGTSWLGPLEVFFVTQNLHGSPEVYGLLTTAASVGALAGAALTAAFAKRLRPTAVYAYALVAAGVLIIGYSRLTTPIGAIIVMFVLGFPLAAMSSMIGPLMLRSTPAHLLGRISTAFRPVNEATSLASLSLAAWLASTVLHDLNVTVASVHFGAIDTIFMGSGIVLVITGIAAGRAFCVQPETSATQRKPEQPPSTGQVDEPPPTQESQKPVTSTKNADDLTESDRLE
jgi:MFS family permease